jgi:hypothetical protein
VSLPEHDETFLVSDIQLRAQTKNKSLKPWVFFAFLKIPISDPQLLETEKLNRSKIEQTSINL